MLNLYLPSELLSLIVSRLDKASLYSLGCTSKCYAKYRTKKYDALMSSITNHYVELFEWIWPEPGKGVRRNYTTVSSFNKIILKLCKRAAESGSLKILEHIYDSFSICINRYIGTKILEAAAKGGHLEIMIWITNLMNINKHISACTNAAGNGHINVLKWLRQNDYSWDEQTCTKAAVNGQIEILKYLHENWCP